MIYNMFCLNYVGSSVVVSRQHYAEQGPQLCYISFFYVISLREQSIPVVF